MPKANYCARGESVDVEIFDYAREAELSHRRGLVRLYRFACADQVRFLRRRLLRCNDARLVLAGLLQPLMEYLAQNRLGLLINPELRQYRWLLEELRVSLFAQSLGTAVPVSAKRLQKQWHRVLDWDKENPV